MAGLQLSTPIATARTILNDPDVVRYSAADLLGYANDCLDVLAARVMPALFYADTTLTCAAGVEQELPVATALSLVRVNHVVGGNALTAAERSDFDSFMPSWRNATAAAALNWMRVDGHPRRFLVYPPADTSQQLDVTYVAVPGEYTVSEDTGLPTVLADAIADYIVYRAESRDDEHVNSNRAAQFLASFVQKVGGTAE
jgi:hypothetical protein